jgi:hypothetical protein
MAKPQSVSSLSSSITQSVSQAVVQGNSLTGLSIDIDAAGKDHVRLQHVEIDVSICVNQDNSVTVSTTETSGNGSHKSVVVSSETVYQVSEQTISQINSITGLSIDIEAVGKAKVFVNHVDWDVEIFSWQSNSAEQESSGGVAEQDIVQVNEVIGVDIDVDVSGKAKVKFNQNDFDVDIYAWQENDASQTASAEGDVWG